MKVTSHQDQVIDTKLFVTQPFAYIQPDMLGFKLEVPRREASMNTKTRPIYLDMQVSLLSLVLNICVLNLVHSIVGYDTR